MRIHLPLVLLVSTLPACAASNAPPPHLAAPPSVAAASPAPAESPANTSAQAALSDPFELGASRGGRFDTERQVLALRRAVELYTQFLERAAGRPELASAVKKGQERLADARETIIFLEQSLRESTAR